MPHLKFKISVAVALTACLVTLPEQGWARGGGGGRGGGGRGFDGRMDDFNRGFDHGFTDEGGRGDSAFRNDDAARPDAFQNTHPASESDLRAGADREYGNSFPTDGFDRVSTAAAGRYSPGAYNNTSRISPADLGARADDVRNGYHNYNAFDRNWWNSHPNAWYYGRWNNDWAWGGVGWPELGGWWGMPVTDEPVDYDYGNNITYQNDTVYYGGKPTVPAATYYTEAQTLATSVPLTTTSTHSSTATSDWKPLGVFSLTQGGQTSTTIMFQLAVDKKGTIRGNYYNVLTNETKTVQGAVDKKAMRAAWTVGTDKTTVYDTGLSNLLKQQGTLLIHIGKSQTQQWNIVKLKKPTK